MWRAAKYPFGVAMATGNLGRSAARAGRFDDARMLLFNALEQWKTVGGVAMRLETEARLAELDVFEGRFDAALEVAGKTLAEADLTGRSGTVVVGQWSRSRLDTDCTSKMRIQPGAILELVGSEAELERAREIIGGTYLRQRGPFLVAGFGEVGRKVHQLLSDAGEEVRVVEREPMPNVDVVGNVLDPSVLERAGIGTARAIVLALNSDDATLFATVIARDSAPDVPVIARVNHARNLDNMHRAGADYALSISDVSGEMLSARLLGRSARPRDERRSVVRVPGSRFAGSTIAELAAHIAGAAILAIERSGARLSPHQAQLRIEAADTLWLCATGSAVRELG